MLAKVAAFPSGRISDLAPLTRTNCTSINSAVEGATMEFRIDAAGREPVYRQIVAQVREGVARGWLAPHDQLPSSRELARTLVINPNTVVHAYAELERQGIVYSRPGLGIFVGEPKAELTKAARRRRVLEILDRFLTEAVHQGFSEAEVLALFSARVEHFQWGPCKDEAR